MVYIHTWHKQVSYRFLYTVHNHALSEQVYLSSAIDFLSVGKQAAERETQN